MADMYGMTLPSLPLGTNPSLPLGGSEVMNRAQYPGPTPDELALERQIAQQQAAGPVGPPSPTPQQTAQANAQVMSWPTFATSPAAQADPGKAYDLYVNEVAPKMLAAAGYTPDAIKQAQQKFLASTPRPTLPQTPYQEGASAAWGSIKQAARLSLREASAGGAVAMGDAEKLAALAKEQEGEKALTPEILKRWQATGGVVWNDLSKTYKNILQEPEGALDSALQAVTGFIPYIAAGVVGSAGGPVGVAGAMGLTAADLAAGGTALSHIQKGLADAKIDPNDIPAVKKWISDNGSKVFGDAWKAGGTEGAITALTMGVSGKIGAAVAKGLTEAAAAGTPEAVAAARSAMKPLAVAKVGTEVGGFGAAGVAGAYAAGDEPTANDVVTQALTMLIPSALHMRGEFKKVRVPELKPGEPKTIPATERKPSTAEEVEPTEEAFTGVPKPPAEPPAAPPGAPPTREERITAREAPPTVEEQQDTYLRLYGPTELDTEAGVRAAVGVPTKGKGAAKALADDIAAVAKAESPEDKSAALESLAKAADDAGKTEVVNRTQALIGELNRQPRQDEIVDALTAVNLARDVIQDAINDHAQEVATTVQTEVKARKQSRAAARTAAATKAAATAAVPVVPETAGISPLKRGTTATGRKTGLKQNAPVQQVAGGKDIKRPTNQPDFGLNQEVPVQAAAPVPERGEPAGVAGAGGAPVVAGPNRPNRLKERQGPNEPDNVISIKSKTMLEQRALLKELADQGINVKKSYFKAGQIEFPTAEDKAKAEAYLAEKQAATEKVAAALTTRAGEAKKANRNADIAYMVKEMGYDREEAKKLYDDAVNEGKLDDLRAEIDANKNRAAEERRPGLKRKPTAEEDKALKEAVQQGLKVATYEHSAESALSVSDVRLSPDLKSKITAGTVDSKQALDYLSDKGDSVLTRFLARQLRLVLGDASIPITLKDYIPGVQLGTVAWGQYVGGVHRGTGEFLHIGINLMNEGLNEHILLHELTHAATVQALHFPRTAMQRIAGQRMREIYRQAKIETYNARKEQGYVGNMPRGFANVEEFVAEAWSNPEFQKDLAKRMYRGEEGLKVRIPTLWQAFKDTVAKLLTGTERSEHMSALEAAIAHSADLFDTARVATPEEVAGKVSNLEVKASAKKEKETEDAFAHTPHDAIVGHDANDDRTHIAYRRPDGTYTMYDVTPEQPRGDPETKREGLPLDAVKRAIVEADSKPLSRRGEDFKVEPVNNRKQLNGWKDGTRRFAAFKQADGTWNVYRGDDLSDRAQRGAPEKFADLAAVQKEYAKGGFLKTEAQDAARMREQEPRDLITYQGPSKLNRNWWDWSNPVKYLGAQMEQQLGRLPEYLRPDIPAILKNSWINRDIRYMERDEMTPMVDKGRQLLKTFGKTTEEFDKDISALVSEERSRYKLQQEGYEDLPELKAKITGNLDAARQHLSGLDQSYLGQLKDYARTLKVFADKTIDQQVQFGLMPADRAVAIKSAYEFYVPLQEGKRTSVGKRATGASAESEHPMQRLIDQRRSTIARGYDNMERRAVYEAASKYNIVLPDGSKMFDIAPILKYGFDKDGNITTILDPLVMSNKALSVMIDGKPYRIAVHDEDFLNAIKDSNTPKLSAMKTAMHGAAVFNAIYGGLKTAASPVFAVKNVIRDAATALAQADPRISTGRLALSFVEPKVWMAALHDAFELGKRTPGGRHGEIADFAARVRDAGGLIDRRSAYGLDNIVEDVRADIDPSWVSRLPSNIKKQFDLEHGAITKPLTIWTKTLENATRMAVFDAAVKSGLSDHDAAVQAKTTTVNFEPKGAYAGLVNPLYVFANAKLQGTRTYAERLGLTGLKGGSNLAERLQRGNRRTQVVTGLGMLVGMLTAKYAYDTSEKDKDGRSLYGKMSDYSKDDYFSTKAGGLSLPLPPELAWSYILGQSLVDAKMNDRWPDAAMRQEKAATRFGTAMIQTFLPGGTSMSDPMGYNQGDTSGYFMRLVTPTPLVMPLDLYNNTNTFGGTLLKRAPGEPLWATKSPTPSPTAAVVAKNIHDTFGMNVAPQQLDYVTKQLFKPQIDVYNAIMGTTGTDTTGHEIPSTFARTFHQPASPFADRQDLKEIQDRTLANTYDPLHKGKQPQLQIFEQSDKQIKTIMKGWDKMTPEQRQRANERAVDIRANTLKRYQQMIQQAEGGTP